MILKVFVVAVMTSSPCIIINIFSDKIKSEDIKFINQTLKDLHPSDIANLIENLSSETREKLIEIDFD